MTIRVNLFFEEEGHGWSEGYYQAGTDLGVIGPRVNALITARIRMLVTNARLTYVKASVLDVFRDVQVFSEQPQNQAQYNTDGTLANPGQTIPLAGAWPSLAVETRIQSGVRQIGRLFQRGVPALTGLDGRKQLIDPVFAARYSALRAILRDPANGWQVYTLNTLEGEPRITNGLVSLSLGTPHLLVTTPANPGYNANDVIHVYNVKVDGFAPRTHFRFVSQTGVAPLVLVTLQPVLPQTWTALSVVKITEKSFMRRRSFVSGQITDCFFHTVGTRRVGRPFFQSVGRQ